MICKRCVMDTTDSNIKFDKFGNCNHCNELINQLRKRRDEDFYDIIRKIKSKKSKSKYDCILGISGGVDSCYTAFVLKEKGLNPLLVHVNNSWNTNTSVKNIDLIRYALNLDLEEYMFDLSEFYEIQRAFLRSNLLDLELPTDLSIPAILHKVAKEYGIKYIVSGGNYASEGILPRKWGYHTKKDMRLYKHIVRNYSKLNLLNTPTFGLFDEFKYKFLYGIKTVYPLNSLPYNKEDARKLLNRKYGWEDYGVKHHESIYTGFWQGYMLPKKWNVDYRKATYSSLICSNQMTRDEALELLKTPSFKQESIEFLKREICYKLDIELKELEKILESKGLFYSDFPNNEKFIDFIHSLYFYFFKR